MSAKHACHDCGAYDRNHYAWCKTKGYSSVGPHPNAPTAEPPTERAPSNGDAAEMCCGGTCLRSQCDYHRDVAAELPPGYDD